MAERVARRRPFGRRLKRAGGDLLGSPLVLGALAVVFGARVVLLTMLAPSQPDALVWWKAGRFYLADPAHMYDPVIQAVGYQVLPLPGTYEGFFNPPLLALLAAPFSLFPSATGVHLWAAFNLVCAAGGLLLLYRRVRLGVPAAGRALFWLVAAIFPPLFADALAGQIGGVIILLACASIFLAQRRGTLAGAFAGVAAGLKVYPAVMLLAAPAGRRVHYAAGLAVGLLVPMAIAFAPLGPAAPVSYVRDILLPVNRIQTVDCAMVSVDTLYLRLVGGSRFIVLDGSGDPTLAQLPVQLPVLAVALFYATALVLLAGVVWSVRRSGNHVTYGLSLALGLGALLPHHVFPYQLLPLLPVMLVVLVKAVERRRWGMLAALLVPLLGLIRDPCSLPFPNTWTIVAMVIFGVCLYAAPMFRTAGTSEAQPSPS